jgi:hypothetical protein
LLPPRRCESHHLEYQHHWHPLRTERDAAWRYASRRRTEARGKERTASCAAAHSSGGDQRCSPQQEKERDECRSCSEENMLSSHSPADVTAQSSGSRGVDAWRARAWRRRCVDGRKRGGEIGYTRRAELADRAAELDHERVRELEALRGATQQRHRRRAAVVCRQWRLRFPADAQFHAPAGWSPRLAAKGSGAAKTLVWQPSRFSAM